MKFTEYKNFGRCLCLEHKDVMALITVDVGPRIIYFGTKDKNFMFEDIDRVVSNSGEYFDENFGVGVHWNIYGGHRVWKSPEDMETYVPDNVKIEVTECEGKYTFVSKIAKRLDYQLTVWFEDDKFRVKNEIVNKSNDTISLAVWALTVMAGGGTLVCKLNDKVDDLNPIQNIVLWPYTDLADSRLRLTRDRLELDQRADTEPLKLGFFLKKRTAYYQLGDSALKIEFEETEGQHADFGCNFETYTSGHILEVEALSALKDLLPSETASLSETFEIVENFDKSTI